MQVRGEPPDLKAAASKRNEQAHELGHSVGDHLMNLVNLLGETSRASRPLEPPSPSHITATPAESIQRLANATAAQPSESPPDGRLGLFLPLFVLLVSINLAVILGNILVILAVNASAKLRNVTNIFIVSLATADLFLGLFVMPYALVYQVLDVWVFGELWCRGWLVTDVWISTASILNLCAISIDRYVAVTRPVKYRSIMTNRRAKCIVAIVWILAFIICLPPLLTELNPSSGQQLQAESPSRTRGHQQTIGSPGGYESLPAVPRNRRSFAAKSTTIFISRQAGDIAATNDATGAISAASIAGRHGEQIRDENNAQEAGRRRRAFEQQQAVASLALGDSGERRRFETSAKSKRSAPAPDEDKLRQGPLQSGALARNWRGSFMGPKGGVVETNDDDDERKKLVPDDIATPETITLGGPGEIKLPFGLSIVLNEAQRAPDDRPAPKGQDTAARAHKSSSSSSSCLGRALECYRWHRRRARSDARTPTPSARCRRMRPEPLQARGAGRAARSLSYEGDVHPVGLLLPGPRNSSVIDARRLAGDDQLACGPLLAATRVGPRLREPDAIFLLWPAGGGGHQLDLANCSEPIRRRCWPMISECLHRSAGHHEDLDSGRRQLEVASSLPISRAAHNKVRSAGSGRLGEWPAAPRSVRDFISNRKMGPRRARPPEMIAVEVEAPSDREAAGQIRLGSATDFERWLEAADGLELVRVRFGAGQWRRASVRPRELLELRSMAASSPETRPRRGLEAGTRQSPIRGTEAGPSPDCGPLELLLHLLDLAGRSSKGADAKGRHPRRWIDNGICADEEGRRRLRDVKMGAAHMPEARSSLAESGVGGHSRANDPAGTMATVGAPPEANNEPAGLGPALQAAGQQRRQHQQLAPGAADHSDDCRNINDYPAPNDGALGERRRRGDKVHRPPPLPRPFGKTPPRRHPAPAAGAVKLKQEAGSGVNRTASAPGELSMAFGLVAASEEMRPRRRTKPEAPFAPMRARRDVEQGGELGEELGSEAPVRRRHEEKLNCALFHQKTYVVYSALGSFFIPMLVMVFFYSRIYLVASRAQKAMQRGYMTTKWPPMATSVRAGKQTSTTTGRSKTNGSVRQSKRSLRQTEGDAWQPSDGPEQSRFSWLNSSENSTSCALAGGDGAGQCKSESEWASSGPASRALEGAQMDHPGRVTLRIHRRTEPPPSPPASGSTQQASQSASFKALALRSSALIARGRESQSLRGTASRLLRTKSSDAPQQQVGETQEEGGNKSKLMRLIALEQQLSMRRVTAQRRTRFSLDKTHESGLEGGELRLSGGPPRAGRKRSSLPPQIKITQVEAVAGGLVIEEIQEAAATTTEANAREARQVDETQEGEPGVGREQADEHEKQRCHRAHRHKRRHRHTNTKPSKREAETRLPAELANDNAIKITIDTSADERKGGFERPEVLLANDDDDEATSRATGRADRSQSQAMPSIVVNWYPEAAGPAEKLQASMPTLTLLPASSELLELDSNEGKRPVAAGGIQQSQSSGSGLGLVQTIPQQVRKQSMLLLSSITSRSGQTLRRLSMVAAHPVDSLLTRSSRASDTPRSSQRWRRRSRRSSSSAVSRFSNSSCRSSSLSESSSGAAVAKEPGEADRMLDRANSLSASETELGHLFGPARRKCDRRRPKSAAGMRSKKTLDDYLMAVAGIDNSSDEQDDEEDAEGAGGYDEDENQSDSSESTSSSSSCASNLTSMLRKENLLIPTIAILSADSVSEGQQERVAGGERGECGSSQLDDTQRESERERPQQMARQEQQLARLDKDVKRAEHLPPSTGLHRQGGLYESATSRRQSQASSSGEHEARLLRSPTSVSADGRQEVPAESRPYQSRSPDLFRLLDPKMRRARALAAARSQPAGPVTGGGASARRRGLKRTSRWHAKRLRAETKAAKTVAIIVGGFIFCWLPFFTAYLSRAVICPTPSCIPQTWLSLSIWLGYINSAINPVIYGLFSTDFRHAFKSIICRCSLRGQSQAHHHDPNRANHQHLYLSNSNHHHHYQNHHRPMASTAANRESAVLSTLADGILKSFL